LSSLSIVPVHVVNIPSIFSSALEYSATEPRHLGGAREESRISRETSVRTENTPYSLKYIVTPKTDSQPRA
jgi:hypothetical protein